MRKVVLYIVCIVLGLQSCIREDLSDCLYGLRIRVVYLLPYGDDATSAPDVQHVKVYVFDEQGILCTVAEKKGDCLSADSWMDIDLAPGMYKVLVWGSNAADLGSSYRIDATIGKTTLTELQLSLRGKFNKRVTEFTPDELHFSDLYYGAAGTRVSSTSEYIMKEVTVLSGMVTEETVELIRDTHHLKVTIDGFRNLVPGWTEAKTDIEVYATGKSESYQWDNSYISHSYPVKYSPYRQKTEEGRYLLDIETQRVRLDMANEKPLMLYVYDKLQQKAIYELDVLEQLLKAHDDSGNYFFSNQEDLDKAYTYNIRLQVGSNLSITIFINDWEITKIYPVDPRLWIDWSCQTQE